MILERKADNDTRIAFNEVSEWCNATLKAYCGFCSDTCCNSSKHRIIVDAHSLPLFRARKIPIISQDKYNTTSEEGLLNNGTEIPKPSVIQVGNSWKNRYRVEWAINSDFCPFYQRDKKRCGVHEDPRRPKDCQDYPLNEFKKENGRLILYVMKSCECFRQERIVTSFKQKFPSVNLFYRV